MQDPIGTTLGHYRIVEKIGEGGMGVVYRARDERLDRDVAIKVLPEEVAQNPDRLARFEREAKAVAKLSHPNILEIHDFGRGGEVSYAVTEYLEGETLREHVTEASLPWKEARGIAGSVADGLAAAHAGGVVHRDLKPENIFLASDGRVKILDFGLATVQTLMETEAETVTAQSRLTREGTVMGTVGYMAPEQVRGEPADARTDIFALGCVLYEMLTGQRAFKRDTQPETMTAILKEDPPSFAESGEAVAPEVIRTVERCLKKKPDRRFQSAADLAFALRSMAGGADEVSTGPVEVATVPTWPRLLPWALLLLAALVAVVAILRPWHDAPIAWSPVAKLTVTFPEGDALEGFRPALAVSPDGSRLVFSVHRGGGQQLFWRQIDEFELTEIPGTDGAVSPFFSPDGNWVGFSVPNEHKLKKVSLVGGSPQTLCTCDVWDACWGEDGTIVFAGHPRAELFRVSADGGEPEPLTSKDTSFQADEIYHLGPQMLPGNEEVLFTATDATMRGRVAVLSLTTGERHTVIEGGTYGRYLPSGHIVYVLAAEGDLLAVPFDIGSLEVTGDPVPVLDGLKTTNLGSAFFTVSDSGTLAYVAGPPASLRRPAWVDHRGRVERLPFPPAFYMSPRMAPDGRRMSVAIAGEDVSVWLLDPARGTSRRFTDEHGNEFWQIWSPDGKDIIYNSFSGNLGIWEGHLLRKPVDGSGPEVLLHRGAPQPSAWSPDGRTMLFQESFADSSTGFDIWALPLDDDRAPIPLIKTRFNEIHPTISPDGRWLAYGSDESGRYEVYVRSYPDTGKLIQISTDGGFEPLWAPDGTQLYYRRENHGGTVLAVSFQGGSTLSVGKPRVLFEATRPGGSSRFFSGIPYGRNYDISPDGKRFLVLEMEPDPPIAQVNVVLNWFDELKLLVPTER